jgi:hypothetical protein
MDIEEVEQACLFAFSTHTSYLCFFILNHVFRRGFSPSGHHPFAHLDHDFPARYKQERTVRFKQNFGMTFAKKRTYTECQKFSETEMNQYFGKTLATHMHAQITIFDQSKAS